MSFPPSRCTSEKFDSSTQALDNERAGNSALGSSKQVEVGVFKPSCSDFVDLEDVRRDIVKVSSIMCPCSMAHLVPGSFSELEPRATLIGQSHD